MKRLTVVWTGLLVGVVVLPSLLAAETFPYRDSLTAEVGFWKQVFLRYHRNEYLIHDARFPWLVYEVVRCDTGLSRRACQQQLKKHRRRWQRILKTLAHKLKQADTLGLDTVERRVLHQFNRLKAHYSLLRAARNVRVQQGIREQFVEGIRRSYRYLPYMRRIFAEAGLPEALIYLPHMESSFNEKAVSHAGAAGMWQFMRSTARLFMKINRVVDERFDPLVSTQAAARLLAYNYAQLKDWALAITAYNYGLAGMKRAVRRYGRNYLKIREHYLRRSFGFASRNFYPEFLAIVEIMDSLSSSLPEVAPLPPVQFVEIILPVAVRLPRFLAGLGLDRAAMRALNPGFRQAVWWGWRLVPAGYRMRLPAGTDLVAVDRWLSQRQPYLAQNPSGQPSRTFAATGSSSSGSQTPPMASFQDRRGIPLPKPSVQPPAGLPSLQAFLQPVTQLARLTPSGRTPPGSSVQNHPLLSKVEPEEPGDVALDPVPFTDVVAKGSGNTTVPVSRPVVLNELLLRLRQQLEPRNNRIVVYPEETLGHIAQWLNLPTYRLRQLNGLSRRQRIYVGQTLQVDFSATTPQKFRQHRLHYHLQLLSRILDFHRPIYLTTHVVQPGESLWGIAEQVYKIPVNILLYFNPVNKLNQLQPGNVIQLPVDS